MQARFLLGPAGSGKTWRCLAEIREELQRDPMGPPLVLLAPKQATFQLERQLLADDSLHGYTRLQILSFDRLAEYVLEQLAVAPGELLTEEGRIMVLRSLLARHQEALQLYRSSAQLPGFAQQLSLLLRELRRSRLDAGTLERLIEKSGVTLPLALGKKLKDVAFLMAAYSNWLSAHGLQDVDEVLDVAAAELRRLEIPSRLNREQPPPIFLAGLWLDGFAEMTSQEIELLAAILPFCERATLAFCLARENSGTDSRFSIWNVVGASFRQCRERLDQLPGCQVGIEEIARNKERSRFGACPALARLESSWAGDDPPPNDGSDAIRMVACQNREAEAIHAARVVRRHVREGGRYRDVTVLVRNLEDYGHEVRRIFTRYGIPFFLDQRESASHHPLAELTRLALRTVAWNWQNEDWFGLLKTGLCGVSESRIDWLENLALARGWEGKAWQGELARDGEERLAEALADLQGKAVLPLKRLADALGVREGRIVTGGQLAVAIRELWKAFHVGEKLERWSEARWPGAESRVYFHEPATVHRTVWEQMTRWLTSLEQAFPDESTQVSLHEWLPIIEAGLANLTIGVIPPAMDQVLVGAVDRTRNPEVAITLVLGLNEGVFPAGPPAQPLLTDAERDLMAGYHAGLGQPRLHQLAHERYLGYIACTRPSKELHLTWSTADDSGRSLTFSSLVDHVARLLGRSKPETFAPPIAAERAEHFSEIIADLLAGPLTELNQLPSVKPVTEAWDHWRSIADDPPLSPALVGRLFTSPWKTSISALEKFAECPFRYFTEYTLGADEREDFNPDVRERGTFQHDVLEAFHARAMGRGGWDQLAPTEGANIVRQIAEELLPTSADGKFARNDATRFLATTLIRNLEQLVRALLEWFTTYRFRPRSAELGFGLDGGEGLPGLSVPLDGGKELVLRGRIDRIDVLPIKESPGQALVVIVDYKSSARDLDEIKLWNGLQLQLLSYLHVVKAVPGLAELLDQRELIPAGVFYVGLKWQGDATVARDAETDDAAFRKGFQHAGRFNQAFKELFDSSNGKSGQFKFRGNSAVPAARFDDLRELVVSQLRSLSERILAGEVRSSPYRHQKKTPCDYCECAAVCRFDPWERDYRVLAKPPGKEQH